MKTLFENDRLGGARIVALLAALLAAAFLWWVGMRKSPEKSAKSAGSTAPDGGGASKYADVSNPVERAREFYATRPYYQQPQGHTEIPEGLPDVRAETCGSCHEAIYREWRISTHRRAWTQDPQFMAEFRKSRSGGHAGDERDDVSWMCVTCHTPMIRQMERLVVGLRDGDIGQPIYVDNPTFDPKMQDDAITCATCHVRDGVVYGPWGDTDAPHPTAKDPELRTSENCTQCHQANERWPSRNLACFFDTGEQFAASRYAEEGQRCQSCHMPKKKRKLAAGYDRPERQTRRHWFGGSLLAKRPKYREQMEKLQSVYGSGGTLDVVPAASIEAPQVSEHGGKETSTCEADGCRTLYVRTTNSRAGHWLPTGDPERHLDIRAVVRRENGALVTEAEQRIASKYEWWPEIVKKYDNRLRPGESIDLPLRVPEGASPLYVDVVAHKYRMYPNAFEHHDLAGRYVRGRVFHRSVWRWAPSGGLDRIYLRTDRREKGEAPEGAFRHHPSMQGDSNP